MSSYTLRLAAVCMLIASYSSYIAAAVEQEPLALIGFHEGTRRVVECKGGYIAGVEVGYVEDSWSFSEPFIGSFRLLCSNKTLSIEHMGDQPDSFIFGRPELKTLRKAECSLGVAGLKWRAAGIRNPDGAEARQGGFTIMCNRADNAPSEVVLEHATTGTHNYNKQFTCKQMPAYAGLATAKMTKAYIWFNRKSFAGLEPLECA